MPAKTGASHGFAAFATLLIGSMLSKFVWAVLPPVGDVSMMAMAFLDSQAGLDVPTSEQFAGTIVVMVSLSFLWGVVYHLSRY